MQRKTLVIAIVVGVVAILASAGLGVGIAFAVKKSKSSPPPPAEQPPVSPSSSSSPSTGSPFFTKRRNILSSMAGSTPDHVGIDVGNGFTRIPLTQAHKDAIVRYHNDMRAEADDMNALYERTGGKEGWAFGKDRGKRPPVAWDEGLAEAAARNSIAACLVQDTSGKSYHCDSVQGATCVGSENICFPYADRTVEEWILNSPDSCLKGMGEEERDRFLAHPNGGRHNVDGKNVDANVGHWMNIISSNTKVGAAWIDCGDKRGTNTAIHDQFSWSYSSK